MTGRSYRSLSTALFGFLAVGLPSGAVTPGQPTMQGSSNSVPREASQTYAVLYRFQGDNARDGALPWGLITDKTGAFYGITVSGGGSSHPNNCGSGCGTVFKLTSTGSSYAESILYRFKGGNDGEFPQGGLVVDGSGALLGVTQTGGGVPGSGTVFKLTPTGQRYVESVVYRFKNNSDGAYPDAGLIAGHNGVFYGTTGQGGANTACPAGCGTVFELAPSGSSYVEKVLYSFQGGSDGAGPASALITDGTGTLYGTTAFGGGSKVCRIGCGTAFKLRHVGARYAETVLYRFKGRGDGAYPYAGLIPDGSGALYGTTERGGSGDGTVYELAPSGSTYVKITLHDFKGGTDGILPVSGLVMVGGALYGTTYTGGSFGWGTVYKVASRAHETLLYTFQGSNDGAQPFAAPIVGNDGMLYGTTFAGGGACNCGTFFRLSP
jgi:uncharacterized repeat protein (TIGR03803 family)